jgi:glucose/arabinose dehydrogenase
MAIDAEGNPLPNPVLVGQVNSDEHTGMLPYYFAYGLRSGFGMTFDPVTGYIWDTENGPDHGDEINLVLPGFNSGWASIQGLASAPENEGANPEEDLKRGVQRPRICMARPNRCDGDQFLKFHSVRGGICK